MVAARRPAAMVDLKDTLEISDKPGKLGEATDYLAINLNIGNCGPGVNLSVNFRKLDAFVVQQLLGFNTPRAAGQGVNGCFHFRAFLRAFWARSGVVYHPR